MSDDEQRDPKLDAAYRATRDEEPPAHLDDAIRAAARRAVDAGPRRPQSWQARWRVPLALAATVVLSVTVTLMVREHQEQELVRSPMPPSAEPEAARAKEAPRDDVQRQQAPQRDEQKAASRASQPQTETREAPARGAQPSAPLSAPANAPPGSPPAAPPSAPLATSPSAPLATPPSAPLGTPSGEPSTAPAVTPAPRSAPAPAPQAERKSEGLDRMERERPAARITREANDYAAPSTVSPAAPSSPAAVAAPARSAESWLAEIRNLLAENRKAEAAAQLSEFRQRYPDHPLPDDLRDVR